MGSSQEWFDWLHAKIGDELAFGLIDSYAVFVEGDRDTVTEVVSAFHDVSFHEDQLLLPV
jgi:hypothetical protein